MLRQEMERMRKQMSSDGDGTIHLGSSIFYALTSAALEKDTLVTPLLISTEVVAEKCSNGPRPVW